MRYALSLFICVLAAFAAQAAHADPFEFYQPTLGDIHQSFISPRALGRPPVPNVFGLMTMQMSCYQPLGELVSVTSWDAGDKTGLYAYGHNYLPLVSDGVHYSKKQMGFTDRPGHTMAQIAELSVGAYLIPPICVPTPMTAVMILRSSRFTSCRSKACCRSSIFPASVSISRCKFRCRQPSMAAGRVVKPQREWLSISTTRRPTAKLRSRSASFSIRRTAAKTAANTLPTTKKRMPTQFTCRSIRARSGFISCKGGSSLSHGRDLNMHYAITRHDFTMLLAFVQKRYPDAGISNDPNNYRFAGFHLDAKTVSRSAPAELGWSMTGLRVATNVE